MGPSVVTERKQALDGIACAVVVASNDGHLKHLDVSICILCEAFSDPTKRLTIEPTSSDGLHSSIATVVRNDLPKLGESEVAVRIDAAKRIQQHWRLTHPLPRR